MLTPMNIIKNCIFLINLFINTPENNGNQKVNPAIIANTAPIERT
jgi:hypothetical protein